MSIKKEKLVKRLAILSTVLVSAAFADSETSETSPMESPHHFRAGADILLQRFYIKDASHKQTYKSLLAGPQIGYEYFTPDSVYFGIDGVYAIGPSRFSEKWYAPMPERPKHKIPKKRTKLRGRDATGIYGNGESRLGYAFNCSTFSLTPFAGIGFSYLQPCAKVDLHTNWYYTTVGLRANQQITSGFDLGLNAKVNYAFHAKTYQRIDAKHNKSWHLDNFWGYEIGMPMTWHVGDTGNWDVQFQPYYQRLDIKGSFFNVGSRLEFIFRF